eukprot:jgi/Mesvir1/29669/Mv21508-RA.1
MGQSLSHCAEAAPAAAPADASAGPPKSLLPPAAAAAAAGPVNYHALPCPVAYEDLSRDAMMSLKPEFFEGVRFDFIKPLNSQFALSHSLFMGSVEVPSQGGQCIKVPAATYEFGANLMQGNTMMIGRILTDGRMSARVKHAFNEALSLKLQAQLTSEPHYSQAMLDFDYKGKDFNCQLKLGNNAFYGINYLQSVTPTLALGGEAFWLGHQRSSGVGLAARYAGDKQVSTAQIATTGLLSLTYMYKVSDKVNLATDFMYNWNTREASSSVGYDYMLRQCRLRGRIDSGGCVGAYLEERLNVGVNFLLSAEVDHVKKDYRFGFGMTIGE